MDTNFISNQPLGGFFNVNLYYEPDTQEGRPALVNTPGLSQMENITGKAPIRGIYKNPIHDRLYVFTKNILYYSDDWENHTRIDAQDANHYAGTTQTIVATHSQVGSDSYLVFADSAGGLFYHKFESPSTFGAVTTVSDKPSGVIGVTYQDGYCLAASSSTDTLYHSKLNDPTQEWSTHSGQSLGYPDYGVAITSLNREVWVFKQKSTEIYMFDDTGTFRFSRVPGGLMRVGVGYMSDSINAGGTVTVIDNNIYFVNDRHEVCRTRGYDYEVISPPQLVEIIHPWLDGVKGQANASLLMVNGHKWYVLAFPTAGYTFVYDITVAALGLPAWFQWSTDGVSNAHRTNGLFVEHKGSWYTGDHTDARIYKVGEGIYKDRLTPVTSQRTFGPTRSNGKRMFYYQFKLDAKPNVGTDTEEGATTTSADAAAGATTLTLTSVSDAADERPVVITLDDASTHQTYQSGAAADSVITIEDALPSAATSGNAVSFRAEAASHPRAELQYSEDEGGNWTSLGKRRLGNSGDDPPPEQVWNGLGSSPSKRWWRIIVPHECEKRIWDGQMHAKAGSR